MGKQIRQAPSWSGITRAGDPVTPVEGSSAIKHIAQVQGNLKRMPSACLVFLSLDFGMNNLDDFPEIDFAVFKRLCCSISSESIPFCAHTWFYTTPPHSTFDFLCYYIKKCLPAPSGSCLSLFLYSFTPPPLTLGRVVCSKRELLDTYS